MVTTAGGREDDASYRPAAAPLPGSTLTPNVAAEGCLPFPTLLVDEGKVRSKGEAAVKASRLIRPVAEEARCPAWSCFAPRDDAPSKEEGG